MSEVDATAKPVEAVQPEENAAEEQPTETTKSEAATEAVSEEKNGGEEKSETKADSDVLKTSAKIDHNNWRNNRKFDPSVRAVSDNPDEIRKQVEFYFGDWNFPQDKFMWESCEGAENKPMPIAKIHSFKRMRSFQPYSAVVAALRDSKLLDVSGEEGEELVKRKTPYKPMPAAKAKAEAATVYVKGFGDETPDTQFDLESFFANYGEVKGLKLRRTNEDLFKGSVFITFGNEEEAKKFLELDPAPKWKEHELKIMSKHDYCEEKSDLIRQGKMAPSSSTSKKFYEGKDGSAKGSRGRGGRGGRPDQDDWKKRRDHDQKNGFRDQRGGGRGRGGRGGRGRGRGGRDGGRDGRDGGRDGGRDSRRENDESKHSGNDAKPRIQSTADEDSSATNGKRAREEDGAGEAPAAKKVDTKAEAATES